MRINRPARGILDRPAFFILIIRRIYRLYINLLGRYPLRMGEISRDFSGRKRPGEFCCFGEGDFLPAAGFGCAGLVMFEAEARGCGVACVCQALVENLFSIAILYDLR